MIEIFYKAQIENNQNRIDSVNGQLENLIKRKYLYSLNYAVSHGNSSVAPFIALNDFSESSKVLLDTINNSLTKEVQESKYGKMLDNFLKSK